MWVDMRVDVAFSFALFSFIYILILSASPVEIRDGHGNILYMKVFAFTLIIISAILVLFGVIRIISPRNTKRDDDERSS